MAHIQWKKYVLLIWKNLQNICYEILGYLIFNYSLINMTHLLKKINQT